MRWKVFTDPKWDKERRNWGEAFVWPDPAEHEGALRFLEVYCLGVSPEVGPKRWRPSWYSRAVKWLGDRPYRIDLSGELGAANLYVGASNFTRDEFLGWVVVWMRECGLIVRELVVAPLQEFAHACPDSDLGRVVLGEFLKRDDEEPNSALS